MTRIIITTAAKKHNQQYAQCKTDHLLGQLCSEVCISASFWKMTITEQSQKVVYLMQIDRKNTNIKHPTHRCSRENVYDNRQRQHIFGTYWLQ